MEYPPADRVVEKASEPLAFDPVPRKRPARRLDRRGPTHVHRGPAERIYRNGELVEERRKPKLLIWLIGHIHPAAFGGSDLDPYGGFASGHDARVAGATSSWEANGSFRRRSRTGQRAGKAGHD